MSDDPTENDEATAELLAVYFAARHPRLEGALLELSPPEVVAGYVAVRETLSALGRTFPPETLGPHLRSRLVGTLSTRVPSRPALLVLDMLVDHLTPGAPLEVPRARLVVPALRARLEAARAAGTPVVYVVDEHGPDDADLAGWGAHNIAGTGGNDVWPELAPLRTDHVVKKPTYSGFVGSRLEDVLEELKVDSLLLTGCLTEIGIIATATDALQRGYTIEVPPDCQAGLAEPLEQSAMAALRLMAPFGPARKARLARFHDARAEG
ncbi:MAG: cysteine hydrolase [Myxococcales bacterium]|nr:cysteine hydrolase [Myxococcales bacterium]MBL0195096.1 cysteine hydrolase [Myxococcales bacterium]HQY61615.1 isochorismatase family cysteine hydrolase [Polyangiaceae bacterium]